MAEYLEKEAFKSWMKENITKNPMTLKAIDYAPSADVEPVRHGHWDDSFDGITPFCSVCRRTHLCINRTPEYCPHCGAKMDEEEKL